MAGCNCTECNYYRMVNAIDTSLPDDQWSNLAEAAWRDYLAVEETPCVLPMPLPGEDEQPDLPFSPAELAGYSKTLRQEPAMAAVGGPLAPCPKCGTKRLCDCHLDPYLDLGEPIVVDIHLCSARPSCGLPDDQCERCHKMNCPSAKKCWNCERSRA
jgi:hypothetical protein